MQSLKPKINVIIGNLSEFDIICFTESWLNPTVANTDIEKICYDNPGNVPNKDRNFNTQIFRKLYLFIICMISRHWFQTKLLVYMVVVAWFNNLETWFGPGQFSLYSMSDADFHMVCL